MKLFIFWMQTIVVATAIKVGRELKFYHDVANRGYCVNLNKTSEEADHMDSTRVERHRFQGLIPVLNVIGELAVLKHYLENRDEIIGEMRDNGLLTELSEEEAKDYQKNPTPIHAFTMNVDHHVKEETESTGDIYFQIEEDKVKVLKQTGCAENMSKELAEEQIEEILRTIQKEEVKVKKLTRKGR